MKRRKTKYFSPTHPLTHSPTHIINFFIFLCFFAMLTLCLPSAFAQQPSEPSEPSEPQQVQPLEKEKSAEKEEKEEKEAESKLKSDQVFVDGDRVVWLTDKNIGVVHEKAVVIYQDIVLKADHVWADLDKNLIRAVGNVHLKIADEETFAEELLFDIDTKRGSIQKGSSFNDPWYYFGDEISKVEADESIVEKGGVTTCPLKDPHFYFQASYIIVKLNKEMIAKHVVFKVGGIPLFYIPAYRRDLRKGKRAKVIFKLGNDSYQGNYVNIISPFWPFIGENKRFEGDFQTDFTSRRGTGQALRFEYDFRDSKIKEILIKVPKDATPDAEKAAREKAKDISERLSGLYDKAHLKRIFIPFKITDEDKVKARKETDEILEKLKAGGDFGTLARAQSDDPQTKANGGDLGFFIKGEIEKEILEPPLEDILFQMQPGEISDIIETEKGYNILKVEDFMDEYGDHEIRAKRILITVQPSDEVKKNALKKADEVEKKLSEKPNFEELAREYSEDPETIKTKGGDVGWVAINELGERVSSYVAPLKKGEHTEYRIQTDEGIYFFKLEDRTPIATFEALAKEYSEGSTAKEGGAIGYKGGWELSEEVYSTVRNLEMDEVSKEVRDSQGYHILKLESKRDIDGRFELFTGDVFSYGRKEAIKVGRSWDMRFEHRMEIPTPWSSLEERKALTWRTRLELGSRDVLKGYGTRRSELRSFSVFTWSSASQRGAGHTLANLIFDKTINLAKEETGGTLQKLPEFSFSRRDNLYELPILKQLNSKLNSVSEKIHSERFPILVLPTLNETSFDFRGTIGNYFRDEYKNEKNIYLLTGDIGIDVSKSSTIKLDPRRELKPTFSINYSAIWHQRDRKGHKNIFSGVFSSTITVTNELFRIYNVPFIPGVSKIRHNITTDVRFYYTPPVSKREDIEFYPFGSSSYIFENKRVSFDFGTKLEVKTKGNRKFTLINFDTRVDRDFTEELGRQYGLLQSYITLTPIPDRGFRLSTYTTHDPNPDEKTKKRFLLKNFRSTLDYNNRKGWGLNLGSAYSRFYGRASRSYLGGFNLRWSRLWSLSFDTNFDQSEWAKRSKKSRGFKDFMESFYSQRITLTRNLHDWDARITWSRLGSGDTARKDFTFQINLIADPSVTMGLGYDAVTDSWGLQSLPVGTPTGAYGFGSSRLGRTFY